MQGFVDFFLSLSGWLVLEDCFSHSLFSTSPTELSSFTFSYGSLWPGYTLSMVAWGRDIACVLLTLFPIRSLHLDTWSRWSDSPARRSTKQRRVPSCGQRLPIFPSTLLLFSSLLMRSASSSFWAWLERWRCLAGYFYLYFSGLICSVHGFSW
jgi:hypothetical protein